MRRFAFLIVSALLIVTLGMQMSQAGRPNGPDYLRNWRFRSIRYGSLQGPDTFNRTEALLTIRAAAARFHPIGGEAEARCIAEAESGLQPRAGAAYRAFGEFQIEPGTWGSWYATFAKVRRHYNVGTDRGNARNNIILALRAMSDSLQPWRGDPCV